MKADPVVVKVTRIKGVGYGVRIWLEGKLWCYRNAKNRGEVRNILVGELRVLDKCGARSPMAHASRTRNYKG